MERQTKNMLWRIPLVATVFVAIFWGIWYLKSGDVPIVTELEMFKGAAGIQLPFPLSRLWDIPFAFVWTFILVFLYTQFTERGEVESEFFLACGLFAGLISCPIFCLIFDLVSGLFICLIGDLVLFLILGMIWFWVEDMDAGLEVGLATGLSFGLGVSLGIGFAFSLAIGLAIGLAFSLTISIFAGLVFGLVKVFMVIPFSKVIPSGFKEWLAGRGGD